MTHLIALVLALRPDIAELTPEAASLGARVVAAEARGEDFVEQYAVAATIGNRVRSGVKWWRSREHRNAWVAVMSGRLQYAVPVSPAVVEPAHRLAFLLGAVAPLGWSRRVVSFATRVTVEQKRLVEVWGDGGPSSLRPLDLPQRAHVFFEFASGT
ncbi:MAG: hypothetical protein KC766_21145 [Myxococcales bacterium]|nr:hypothetical protein [Myxococcales bacterium]